MKTATIHRQDDQMEIRIPLSKERAVLIERLISLSGPPQLREEKGSALAVFITGWGLSVLDEIGQRDGGTISEHAAEFVRDSTRTWEEEERVMRRFMNAGLVRPDELLETQCEISNGSSGVKDFPNALSTW